MFDRLSLYFCMRDVEGGEAASIGDYRIEPVAPCTVAMEPFPSDMDPVRFSLLRRIVPKGGWNGAASGREFLAIEPESLEVTIQSQA